MELVLGANDAADWVYRGEGAANLVLAYRGSSPRFVGKVLRVQKVKRNGSECEEVSLALSAHECLLWKDTRELLSAPTREIAEHLYVQHVMCPLLGSKHVDAGIRVLVTREFLESVGNNVRMRRPSWRVNDAEVNMLCDSALIISDHSIFPQDAVEAEFCISVEVKPKCGFLPLSGFIQNAVKRSVARFKLHQALKLHQGKISQISEYDPLDLFSGSKARILKSIKDLFVTPQNNFRVFLNGSLIYGNLGGGKDNTNCRREKAFEDVLKCVIQADDGRRTTSFLELVAEVVSESGLLDRLLEVQKLDTLDIEGAIHAYYDVISQPCLACKELGEDRLSDKYHSLHSVPLDESLKIVRDYLISATSKDLSLMISFRPREKAHPESPYRVIFLPSTDQSFDYKVSFIDLDMKPLEKMAYYYKLDKKIVGCYAQMTKTANQPDNSSTVVETPYRDQSSTIEDASHSRDSAEGCCWRNKRKICVVDAQKFGCIRKEPYGRYLLHHGCNLQHLNHQCAVTVDSSYLNLQHVPTLQSKGYIVGEADLARIIKKARKIRPTVQLSRIGPFKDGKKDSGGSYDKFRHFYSSKNMSEM